MFATIPDQILTNSLRNGRKVALVERSGEVTRKLTYSELYSAASRLAWRLSLSTKRGDRIALVAGNVLEIHVFYLTCAILGAVAVPINVTFTAREMAEVLDSVTPVAIYFQSAYENGCKLALSGCVSASIMTVSLLPSIDQLLMSGDEPANSQREDQPALGSRDVLNELRRPWAILHTSGTTSGRKKGVARNQAGSIGGIFVHQAALHLSETDVFMAVWPSYGISSFFFVMSLLYLNAKVVLLDADTAADPVKSWEILNEEEVTFSTGSPLHFENWSRMARRMPSEHLRIALLSGASTSGQNKLVLADLFGERCTLCEAYGSTECGVITLSTDLTKEGVGCEPPGVPRVLIDPQTNEILVNQFSPMFMNGYILADNDISEEACYVNGWFKTGDVGKRDEFGNLHLLGRVDDRIGLPSGHDLYPAEVESVLSQVTIDRQVFVSLVGGALVGVVTGDSSAQVEDTLRKHAESNLAPLKRPARYVFVPSLPLTSTNKVKRKDLAMQISKL